MAVNILDVISPDQLVGFEEKMTTKGEICLNGPCPSCGWSSSGSNSSGMTIFPTTNTCFCHGSQTIFNLKESVALFNGLISCMEGRQKL